MFEKPESETREEPEESGGVGIGEDTSQGGGSGGIGGQGGEGEGAAEGTPPIGEQDKPEQTTHDAPPEDVGAPDEEEDRTD